MGQPPEVENGGFVIGEKRRQPRGVAVVRQALALVAWIRLANGTVRRPVCGPWRAGL
jgi:hypothetical protein